jgi:hypothetical protein
LEAKLKKKHEINQNVKKGHSAEEEKTLEEGEREELMGFAAQ